MTTNPPRCERFTWYPSQRRLMAERPGNPEAKAWKNKPWRCRLVKMEDSSSTTTFRVHGLPHHTHEGYLVHNPRPSRADKDAHAALQNPSPGAAALVTALIGVSIAVIGILPMLLFGGLYCAGRAMEQDRFNKSQGPRAGEKRPYNPMRAKFHEWVRA